MGEASIDLADLVVNQWQSNSQWHPGCPIPRARNTGASQPSKHRGEHWEKPASISQT